MEGRWASLKRGSLAIPGLQEGWSSGRLLSGYRRVKDEVGDPSRAPASASKGSQGHADEACLARWPVVMTSLLSLKQGHREEQSGDGRWAGLIPTCALQKTGSAELCNRVHVLSVLRKGRLPEGALAESGINHAAALPVSPSQTSA